VKRKPQTSPTRAQEVGATNLQEALDAQAAKEAPPPPASNGTQDEAPKDAVADAPTQAQEPPVEQQAPANDGAPPPAETAPRDSEEMQGETGKAQPADTPVGVEDAASADAPAEAAAAPAEAAAAEGDAAAAAESGDTAAAPAPAEAAAAPADAVSAQEGEAAAPAPAEAADASAPAEAAAALAGFKLPEIEPAFDEWVKAQLEASAADSKDTEEFRYITFTEVPPFTDGHKSLMRKTLTPELFEKLKDVKSSKGYSLSNGIQAGVLRPHLGVGFTCGDEECFELFKDLVYPIVQGWHGFDPATQTHKSDLDASKLVFTEEQAAKFGQYVKSTRVRAARNIAGYSLPAGASSEDRLAVEGVLKEAFGSLPEALQGKYYPLGELTGAQEEELQAGGFLFQKPGPMQLLGAAGAGRNWPEGRGIFHNESKTVLCWCNEEDQCRIIAMENGGDVKGVFERFCSLSHAIKGAAENNGKALMESPNLGFLGTCPSNLGTGLRASVMVVLPELNKDVHKLEEICAGFDLQPRGSSGEHSAAVGGKWDISNKQRIGFSEVELVQKMIDGVTKLIAMEEELAAASASAGGGEAAASPAEAAAGEAAAAPPVAEAAAPEGDAAAASAPVEAAAAAEIGDAAVSAPVEAAAAEGDAAAPATDGGEAVAPAAEGDVAPASAEAAEAGDSAPAAAEGGEAAAEAGDSAPAAAEGGEAAAEAGDSALAATEGGEDGEASTDAPTAAEGGEAGAAAAASEEDGEASTDAPTAATEAPAAAEAK